MKPYYQHGGVIIYHGDCREVLTQVKVEAALLLTDPPYGQSFVCPSPRSGISGKMSGGGGLAGGKHAQTIAGDDTPFDPTWMLPLAETVVIWGAHKFAHRLPEGSWLIWDKREGKTVNDFGDAECAWRNGKYATRLYSHLWSGLYKKPGSAEARNRPNSSAAQTRLHPAQKPLALMSWCILQAGTTGRVLDPYMGSGTTLLAAKALGFSAVGVELDEAYCEIAAKRLSQEVMAFP